MKCKEALKVNIRQTVAPGEHECCVADVRREPLDATAGIGQWSRVDKMDDPVRFAPAFVNDNGTVASAHGEVRAVVMQLQEMSNDRLFLVPERDNELVHSIEGVMLHYVPKDRLATDLYHWFRARVRFLGEPRPHSARQNRNLHSARQPLFRPHNPTPGKNLPRWPTALARIDATTGSKNGQEEDHTKPKASRKFIVTRMGLREPMLVENPDRDNRIPHVKAIPYRRKA